MVTQSPSSRSAPSLYHRTSEEDNLSCMYPYRNSPAASPLHTAFFAARAFALPRARWPSPQRRSPRRRKPAAQYPALKRTRTSMSPSPPTPVTIPSLHLLPPALHRAWPPAHPRGHHQRLRPRRSRWTMPASSSSPPTTPRSPPPPRTTSTAASSPCTVPSRCTSR